MEVRIVGDPDGGPPVELAHTDFSYAGKFVMSDYGKALAVSDGSILGAIAFNRDRTARSRVWFRYLTVRKDRRGEGIGSRLAARTADRLLSTAISDLRIAVNNPFAYEACYKAGFGYTGRQTGLAEVILAKPDEQSVEGYQSGLDAFRARNDLEPSERAFIDERKAGPPPEGNPSGGP